MKAERPRSATLAAHEICALRCSSFSRLPGRQHSFKLRYRFNMRSFFLYCRYSRSVGSRASKLNDRYSWPGGPHQPRHSDRRHIYDRLPFSPRSPLIHNASRLWPGIERSIPCTRRAPGTRESGASVFSQRLCLSVCLRDFIGRQVTVRPRYPRPAADMPQIAGG